jgi:hypothetical protein
MCQPHELMLPALIGGGVWGGHVLGLGCTLTWLLVTSASCDKRHAVPAAAWLGLLRCADDCCRAGPAQLCVGPSAGRGQLHGCAAVAGSLPPTHADLHSVIFTHTHCEKDCGKQGIGIGSRRWLCLASVCRLLPALWCDTYTKICEFCFDSHLHHHHNKYVAHALALCGGLTATHHSVHAWPGAKGLTEQRLCWWASLQRWGVVSASHTLPPLCC